MILRLTPRERLDRCSRGVFRTPIPAGAKKILHPVRYFAPLGDIPVRKAFPGGGAAHPDSEV